MHQLIGYQLLFVGSGSVSVGTGLIYFVGSHIEERVLTDFDPTYMKVMLSGAVLILLFQVSRNCHNVLVAIGRGRGVHMYVRRLANTIADYKHNAFPYYVNL